MTPKEIKNLKNGSIVRLYTGTVFSNIVRLSKGGRKFRGTIIEIKHPDLSSFMGGNFKFDANNIKEIVIDKPKGA